MRLSRLKTVSLRKYSPLLIFEGSSRRRMREVYEAVGEFA